MPIETLEDIVEGFADKLGIYGAHDEFDLTGDSTPDCKCRCCWTSALKDRIRRAVEVEQALSYEADQRRQSAERAKAKSELEAYWRNKADRDIRHGKAIRDR